MRHRRRNRGARPANGDQAPAQEGMEQSSGVPHVDQNGPDAPSKVLIDGLNDGEAKQRGIVAAIMGAQAKLGIRKEHHEEFQAQKEAAEKKKKTTITAESFDKQVANKMGKFFEDLFLPALKKLVEAGLSYDEVKRIVKIPATWGAHGRGAEISHTIIDSPFGRMLGATENGGHP